MGSLVKTNRAMKTILFLCLSVVSIKALVLPLPLKFGGNKSPTLKSIETCPGHENDVMVVIEGTTDEEICMPGNSTINVHTRVSEDLPMDLVIKMDLQKVTPFPMTVPCLDGVGSSYWRGSRPRSRTWDPSWGPSWRGSTTPPPLCTGP